MNFKKELAKTVKTRFISGVLVIVPLFVAIAVLKFVIETIDNFLKPHIIRLIGQEFAFPFIGLLITLILIILAGIFTTNVFGQKMLRYWEYMILRIPLFKTVYSASKQLVEGIAVPEKRTFDKVVMVEYPRQGIYAIGFLVNRIKIRSSDEREYCTVFIPNTPTPFTGTPILLPPEDIKVLSMSIEDGLKFIVSGGVSSPKEFAVINSAGRSDITQIPFQRGRNKEID
ncbi:MAG: hypothetical protein A2W25_03110 [candidate division Zixibacteria bacterium RBG_16_53_22]|nr:MAG: hypothetical protein A2W25_03110 [candidate division Zixibacteria bacterium RBG_16_53_22]